jgi:hypothetical protein
MMQAMANLLAEFEENLNALVVDDVERQAREMGLDEATVAKVRLHSRARQQWRWN